MTHLVSLVWIWKQMCTRSTLASRGYFILCVAVAVCEVEIRMDDMRRMSRAAVGSQYTQCISASLFMRILIYLLSIHMQQNIEYNPP